MLLASSFVNTFMGIHLLKGWFPATVWYVTIVGIGLIAIGLLLRRSHKPVLVQLIVASISAVAAFFISWFCSNSMIFGAELGWKVIHAVSFAFFIMGWTWAAVFTTRGWKRAVAIVLIPVTLLASAIHVDSIYGEYTTIGSIFNYSPYPLFHDGEVSTQTESLVQWKQQAELGESERVPDEGKTMRVNIPNTRSGFKARQAMVWLPPAAFAKRPPKLPVMVMLAGQPGSPGRYFGASNTVSVLTAYAHEHHGLAPIVVSPDQNGADDHNSLCSNTIKYGNAETYLTQDVPDWIRHNLPVSDNPDDWVIGGFSQGGTCATSLAPNYPELFGNVLAVDGELQPTDGTVAQMVRDDFAGDKYAYDRMVPTIALRENAPSNQTMVIAAGNQEAYSMNNVKVIGAAAFEAGWHVVELESLNAGHTWKAVNQVFAAAMPWYCERMGLGSVNKTWEDYSGIEVLRG